MFHFHGCEARLFSLGFGSWELRVEPVGSWELGVGSYQARSSLRALRFHVDPELLALLVEVAPFESERARGLRDTVAVRL